MNAKQAAFVHEYLVDKNATQAATRAGYSARTASSAGDRLLRNSEIREAIDQGMSDIASRVGVTVERILKERARLAFSDIRKIMHDDGRVKLPNELDEDTAAAIISFRTKPDGSVEYRFAGKDQSIAALEKRLGLNEKPISFDLPEVVNADGCEKAQQAIIKALAAGAILSSEAETLAGLVEHQRRSLETNQLFKRLESIESQLMKGATL